MFCVCIYSYIPSNSTVGNDLSPIAQNGDSLEGSSLADPLSSSTWKQIAKLNHWILCEGQSP